MPSGTFNLQCHGFLKSVSGVKEGADQILTFLDFVLTNFVEIGLNAASQASLTCCCLGA
jgi:hypothetical protein